MINKEKQMALLDNPSGNPPDKPSGNSPGEMNKSVSAPTEYSSVVEITEEYVEGISGLSYSSSNDEENVLHITGGNIFLSDMTIEKTGDGSSEQDDFYGGNSAVLVTDGALEFVNGTINTSGAYANAVFAYGEGVVNLSKTKIKTTENNSGGLMVAGGGYITAESVTVETLGNSSAAIRSDRGGGTMEISGGSYETSGAGSPAIYSTADVRIKNGARLVSESSEGVIIEGANKVSLEGVSLTDTNNVLHGNSETYKNIFIYQSMSGDAEEGKGTFSADSSIITTNKGDTFFVTNTTADISLSGNKITNNDSTSVFLRASASKWGTEGKNGGIVTLDLSEQVVEGDIMLDNISTLSLSLLNQSFYKGATNSENSAKSVSLSIDETSTIVLTSDSYVSELKNTDKENSNIYSNGYKLFVNGTEVATNASEAPQVPEVVVSVEEQETESDVILTTGQCAGVSCLIESEYFIPGMVIGSSVALILILILVLIIHGAHKKKNNSNSVSIDPVPPQEPYGTNGYVDSTPSAPQAPSSDSSSQSPQTPPNPQK